MIFVQTGYDIYPDRICILSRQYMYSVQTWNIICLHRILHMARQEMTFPQTGYYIFPDMIWHCPDRLIYMQTRYYICPNRVWYLSRHYMVFGYDISQERILGYDNYPYRIWYLSRHDMIFVQTWYNMIFVKNNILTMCIWPALSYPSKVEYFQSLSGSVGQVGGQPNRIRIRWTGTGTGTAFEKSLKKVFFSQFSYFILLYFSDCYICVFYE